MDSAKRSRISQNAALSSPNIAPSQLGAGNATNIFSLPRKIRDDIYEMVLRVPHPLYLFQETDTLVETFAPERPFRWHALLYTSRQVNVEASAVLYRTNNFSVVDMTPNEAVLLKSFLCGIGPVNAGSLSHVCASFPSLDSLGGQDGHCQLREDSAEIVALLTEKCGNLKTLELVVHNKNCSWLTIVAANTSKYIPEALVYIDKQLKAIVTIEQILVKVSSGTLTPSARTAMRDLGWLILTGSSH